MVLTQHICLCIYYCLESINALHASFPCIIIRHSNTTNWNVSTSDSTAVGRELPVTTFDNALSLSKGVDLCLTLQHHLFHVSRILGKTRRGTHLFSHVKDI